MMVVAADRPSVPVLPTRLTPPIAPTLPLTAGMLIADEVREADCNDCSELELPWCDATSELQVEVVTRDDAC